MSEKRFVGLSNANLVKVWAWAEQHEDNDPIAEAYSAACYAVGTIRKIDNRLASSWPTEGRDSWKWTYVSCSLEKQAFEYRDTLGRVIIDMLKREAKKGATA